MVGTSHFQVHPEMPQHTCPIRVLPTPSSGPQRRQRPAAIPGQKKGIKDMGRWVLWGRNQGRQEAWESGLPVSGSSCELRLPAPNTCFIVLLTSAMAYKDKMIKNFQMVTRGL